jgi:hypothetical protein
MGEAKKKKRKRVGPTASADTTEVSSDVETINVEDEEDDARSPSTATAPSTETPHKVVAMEEQVTEMPRSIVTAVEC